MVTDTPCLGKAREKKLRASGTLDDVVEYLHVQGVSILDALKVVRNTSGMSPGDAKQAVSCHATWQSMVKANEALHDESEAASREEKQPTSTP